VDACPGHRGQDPAKEGTSVSGTVRAPDPGCAHARNLIQRAGNAVRKGQQFYRRW